MVVGEDQCRRCPIGYVPGPTKDLCLKLDASNLDWNSPWTFFPILLSTLGIGVTLEVREKKTKTKPIEQLASRQIAFAITGMTCFENLICWVELEVD